MNKVFIYLLCLSIGQLGAMSDADTLEMSANGPEVLHKELTGMKDGLEMMIRSLSSTSSTEQKLQTELDALDGQLDKEATEKLHQEVTALLNLAESEDLVTAKRDARDALKTVIIEKQDALKEIPKGKNLAQLLVLEDAAKRRMRELEQRYADFKEMEVASQPELTHITFEKIQKGIAEQNLKSLANLIGFYKQHPDDKKVYNLIKGDAYSWVIKMLRDSDYIYDTFLATKNYDELRKIVDFVSFIIDGGFKPSEEIIKSLLPDVKDRTLSLVLSYIFLKNKYQTEDFLAWVAGILVWYSGQPKYGNKFHNKAFLAMSNYGTFQFFQTIKNCPFEHLSKAKKECVRYFTEPMGDKNVNIKAHDLLGNKGNYYQAATRGFTKEGRQICNDILSFIEARELIGAVNALRSHIELEKLDKQDQIKKIIEARRQLEEEQANAKKEQQEALEKQQEEENGMGTVSI